MTLVDLHSHILPGVDDGSPDLETSLELARESVADGVTHMLLTPHHMDRDRKSTRLNSSHANESRMPSSA